MAESAKLREVEGITPIDFALWRRKHPVTVVVMRLLEEQKRIFEELVINNFLDGSMGLGDDKAQCLRGQIIEIVELLELDFAKLESFFTDNGTATEQAGLDRASAEGADERGG
jgi:hypothetical protein